jgi:hypothetical protein
MKNRARVIGLISLIVLGLVGCQNKTDAQQNTAPVKASSSSQNAQPTPKSTTGMWLCDSPWSAADFWNNVLYAQNKLGITLTPAIAAQIAAKEGADRNTPSRACVRVDSDNLKVIGAHSALFGSPLMELTDGKIVGWADSDYYVMHEKQRESHQ